MRKSKKRIKKLRLSFVFIIIILVAYIVNSSLPASDSSKEKTFVTRVIDGDTVIVEGGQRIRLLNIDTRERGENCYGEAKKRLEELILLKDITMERDKENKDRYNRLLRYIYFNGTMINIQMVREGFAIVYIIEPNEKYRQQFVDAEKEARNEGGCIWTTKP